MLLPEQVGDRLVNAWHGRWQGLANVEGVVALEATISGE